MADAPVAKRRLTAPQRAMLWLGGAWALVLSMKALHVGFWDVREAIGHVLERVLSGFPSLLVGAMRAVDALRWALDDSLAVALWLATFAAPVVFLVRLVARARIRAGQGDWLARPRAWLEAHPRARAALVVSLPAACQALFLHGTIHRGVEEPAWFFALYALTGGLVQVAAMRLALRAKLAPFDAEGRDAGSVVIEPDEIRFRAVAVTRETKVAIGALAAVSLAVAAWVASLPILVLFKDPRVFGVIAGYIAVAAASAALFRGASRISVGVDGVYVGGTSRARFFAYRDLDGVRVQGGDLELVRRDRVVLRLQLHGEDAPRREAIALRIEAAIARVHHVERDAAANFVTSRSTERVADSLRGGGDYRMPSVSREDLWALVEGSAVDAATRTAAAEVLAHGVDPGGRERLRVAASQCADPRVRVALEELAAEPEEGDAVEEEYAGGAVGRREALTASPTASTRSTRAPT
jgi:hypothetical protein